MLKRVLVFAVSYVCLLSFAALTVHAESEITESQVIALVDQAAKDLEAGASQTLEKISAGEAPYKDKEQSELYVFVYDDQVNMLAHPKKELVGRSYKGLPDVRGKAFRDEIVEGALKNGTGWVSYSYQKPGESGMWKKKTYYKLVEADGKKYVVCAGMYDS